MAGDAAARLVQEQPAQRIVGAQRLHLLEDGRARRRQHATDDDVADLPSGVAADDGEHPGSRHQPAFQVMVIVIVPVQWMSCVLARVAGRGDLLPVAVPIVGHLGGLGYPLAALSRAGSETSRLLSLRGAMHRVSIRQPPERGVETAGRGRRPG